MYYRFVLIPLLLIALAGQTQSSWQLATQQDGIKVYLKDAVHSDIKMLKVTCEIPATVDAVLALLLDIPASEKWIPQTKSWRYLRQVSPMECYYYSELRMPWPVSNRDYVVHLQASQHPASRVVTLDAKTVAGEVPEKEGIVRVNVSTVKWILQPIQNGRTFLTYELFTNPGGSIPAWVVNYFAKGAAVDIIKKMIHLVQQPPYRDARLNFLAK